MINSATKTVAVGSFGPKAPQTLCNSTQHQQYFPCSVKVGPILASLTDLTKLWFRVLINASTTAQTVYQGKIGDFGANSIAFYNVPVLPPAYRGISRTFRIIN
jgi:hypothetical protein